MDNLSFFYKHCMANNPYYAFDKGIFLKWTKTDRPYMPPFAYPPIPSRTLNAVTINLDAWVYSLSIKIKKEIDFAKKGESPKVTDYPACAAACYNPSNPNEIALNYSWREDHQVSYNQKMLDLFNDRLETGPYKQSAVTGCKNPVGNCAEQHVADDMLTHSACSIADLHFSVAFRPRTMEYIPACTNCKALFPQL